MQPQIIGISGSPIPDSNTDRLVGAILNATRLESEFVKLSKINVRPCFACKKCVPDNICKIKDDFQELAEKIKDAKALVIGGYVPYSQIDGFTKALLERFWSLRHQKNLLRGKLGATVMTGIAPDALTSASQSLAAEMTQFENMELIGQLTIQGNIPCVYCGVGDECEMSGVKQMYGTDAKTSDFEYSRAEDQKEVWEEAMRIGRLMGERL